VTPLLTTADALAFARAAGRAGRSWMDLAADPDLGAYCEAHIETFDTAAIETAWTAGRRERRTAGGWVTLWTTAPADYDSFQTETLEACGSWRGRELRRVLVDPRYVTYHRDRYASGLYGSWTEDPRLAEIEVAARRERLRLDDERRAARRVEGLAWLAAATDDELDAAIDADEVESRGLTYAELRAEILRREAAAAAAARAADWARCAAAVPMGAILVDDGVPAQRGIWGVIPGRPARIYYAVRIQPGSDWQGLADQAIVESSVDGAVVGSLAGVAARLADGSLRIAPADDVPPEPVTRRIGHDRHREIMRVAVGDRVVWVGRPCFAAEVLVLDERGRIVRARRLREMALRARKDAAEEPAASAPHQPPRIA